MTTFVDTSAFMALLNAADPRHDAARVCLRRMRSVDEPLATHSYVLVETIALVHRRFGTDGVRRLAPLLGLVPSRWIDRDVHERAFERLVADDRRGTSFVDWVSFVLMRNEGIDRAFAFDRDFVDQGFEVLPG